MPHATETTHPATASQQALKRSGVEPRLAQQLLLVREIDALKERWRKTLLISGERVENDAEHSWEMALMAVVLAEYAPAGCDLHRVIKMLLIHDLVEIDAGDTFVYDAAAVAGQEQREREAAERIFGLLPEDQGRELHSLWQEFEARQSADARFARAMDRLQPLLHNYHTQGRIWREHGIRVSQVRKVMAVIGEASAPLGELAEQLLNDALAAGYLAQD